MSPATREAQANENTWQAKTGGGGGCESGTEGLCISAVLRLRLRLRAGSGSCMSPSGGFSFDSSWSPSQSDRFKRGKGQRWDEVSIKP